MRRIAVPERVRRDRLVDAGLTRGAAHRLPDHSGGNGRVGSPPVPRAGEQVCLRSHPAVVLAERGEERGTERHIAITTAFALLDTEHHPRTIDVTDFETTHFAAAQAGAGEREPQRAVIESLRPADQALHFLRTEDDRQAASMLRVRQVFFHVPPLQHAQEEEPQGGDLSDHRAHGQLPVFEQEDLVASEVIRPDAIEPSTRVAVEGLDDFEVALAGGRRVVAAHELVVQTLQQLGHRHLL